MRCECNETVSSCREWAAATEANRGLLRRLRKEEAALLSSRGLVEEAAQPRQLHPEWPLEAWREGEALRSEIEELAEVVSDSASWQIADSHELHELRAEANLARYRWCLQLGEEERQRVGKLRDKCRKQLEDTEASMAALRARARALKSEAAALDREAEAAKAALTERAASTELAASGGRAELALEAKRRKSAKQMEGKDVEAEAVLRRRVDELAENLSSSQASTRRLAYALREAESSRQVPLGRLASPGGMPELDAPFCQGADSASALAALRRRASAAAAVRLRLEAELQQQRDATLAWRSSADDLASGHRDAAEQADRAIRFCRSLLFEASTAPSAAAARAAADTAKPLALASSLQAARRPMLAGARRGHWRAVGD